MLINQHSCFIMADIGLNFVMCEHSLIGYSYGCYGNVKNVSRLISGEHATVLMLFLPPASEG